MSLSQIDPFLFGAMAICVLMAIVSCLRFKTRGVSAFIMAAAFVVLGLGMFLIHVRAPIGVVIGLAVLLVFLLGADFAARSAQQGGPP